MPARNPWDRESRHDPGGRYAKYLAAFVFSISMEYMVCYLHKTTHFHKSRTVTLLKESTYLHSHKIVFFVFVWNLACSGVIITQQTAIKCSRAGQVNQGTKRNVRLDLLDFLSEDSIQGKAFPAFWVPLGISTIIYFISYQLIVERIVSHY